MAGAADIAAPAPAPVSVADPVPGSVKAKAGLAPDVVVGVSAQLVVVLGAARAGGLSGSAVSRRCRSLKRSRP